MNREEVASMLKRAMEITKEALGSMTGPDGKPYLDHALRVMEQMETCLLYTSRCV